MVKNRINVLFLHLILLKNKAHKETILAISFLPKRFKFYLTEINSK